MLVSGGVFPENPIELPSSARLSSTLFPSSPLGTAFVQHRMHLYKQGC